MCAMITARIRLGKPPARGGKSARAATEELTAALYQNGQIHESSVLRYDRSMVDVFVTIPEPSALNARHHSDWSRKAWEKTREAFGRAPSFELLEEAGRGRRSSWRRASWLYLMTHAFDEESPVRSPNDRDPIPLYEIPIPYEERGYLVSWARSYRECDSLWVGSSTLEMTAYRETAEPESSLSRRGRAFAALIESFCGQPVYYYLTRYYGRSEHAERRRRCPGCGGSWRLKQELVKNLIAFRCESCRLVSNDTYSTDERRHYQIGEWRRIARSRRRSL